MKCPDYLNILSEEYCSILCVLRVIINYGTTCNASRAALYVGLHAAQDGPGSKVITMATEILCRGSEGQGK